MDIVARDVIGTAHVATKIAEERLGHMLTRSRPPKVPAENEFRKIILNLNKALSDVMLAQHMLAPDCEDTTYLALWDRDERQKTSRTYS